MKGVKATASLNDTGGKRFENATANLDDMAAKGSKKMLVTR